MAINKWTPAQEDAINARGGTLLVSAAAGSGKTAVLVERIVQRITDEKNPCDIDELLVVTFANDAAAEMKERIYSRLRAMLEEKPDDAALIRQQLILPRAKVCTIDSFFGEIVRENASLLGISADFKVVTGTQHEAYISQAIKLALDEMYERMPDGFEKLVELVSDGRNDRNLEKTILKIYYEISAYPFPQDVLDRFVGIYEKSAGAQDTAWGKLIIEHCKAALKYIIRRYSYLLSLMEDEIEKFSVYHDFVSQERAELEKLLNGLCNSSWDEIVVRFRSFRFEEAPSTKGMGISSHKTKKLTTAIRKDSKSIFESLCKEFLFASAAEIELARQESLPIIRALVETVSIFRSKLREIMLEDNVLGFNDIQHLAFAALCQRNGDKVERTSIAQEMSERFKEILIDEYQDVNAVQHMIFEAVSQDGENFFRVGDVKQSIYAFRQAMPDIFLDMRDNFNPYETGKYPAKIILDCNFRSGKAVIDTVNHCFGMLMSRQTGGIAYDHEDELKLGAKYETAKQSELDIVALGKGEDGDTAQAEFIADRIQSIVNSGQLTTLKDGTKRPVAYSDFCILLRSAGNHAGAYVKVLKDRGINVIYELSGDFFDCEEIRIMISLLRAIDNPLLDIEVMSVMFSPLYGFSPDELAQIRINKPHGALYSAVSDYASKGDERCRRFLEDMDRYRLLASTLTSDELIRRIYEATCLTSICKVMGKAEQRSANLMLLLNYAQSFESSGFRGLSAFVRFMEKLEQSDKETDSSLDSSALDNAVRVMTIHKSKGLEFPYCIIAGMSTRFNRSNENSGVIACDELGVGFDLRDVDTLLEYSTVQRAAVKRQIINSDMAEQLRILYVAMTRAKEKLIMVAAERNIDDLLDSAIGAYDGGKLDSFFVYTAGNQIKLILPCLINCDRVINEAASAFELCNDDDGTDSPFCINVVGSSGNAEINDDEPAREDEAVLEPSCELEAEIAERLSYKYPYLTLSKAVSKTTASNLKASAFNKEFFASEIPAFMAKSGMTAMQRGTAAHRFLECCDFARCSDLTAEASRLVGEGKLTQEQADSLDFALLANFFESDLFSRIRKSDNVNREFNFAVNISACELYPDLPKQFANELVMVQGAIDCFFEDDGEIIIVDYKTDRVTDEHQLRDRYTAQLELYKAAVEQITEKKVKKCVLYSITLGKTVEI